MINLYFVFEYWSLTETDFGEEIRFNHERNYEDLKFLLTRGKNTEEKQF